MDHAPNQFSSIGASQKFSACLLPRSLMLKNSLQTNRPHHMSRSHQHHHQHPFLRLPADHFSPTPKAIPTSSERALPATPSARTRPLACCPKRPPNAVYRSTSPSHLVRQLAASKTSPPIPVPERGNTSASIHLWSNASLSRNQSEPRQDSWTRSLRTTGQSLLPFHIFSFFKTPTPTATTRTQRALPITPISPGLPKLITLPPTSWTLTLTRTTFWRCAHPLPDPDPRHHPALAPLHSPPHHFLQTEPPLFMVMMITGQLPTSPPPF